MQAVSNDKKQFDELGILLEDMKSYLQKVEQGCPNLSAMFHVTTNSEAVESLTQIMEGLMYYQKLLKSAAVLLTIDVSEDLFENYSVRSLFDQLSGVFTSICEATENEDYSLLTDITEYDLMPAISVSQGVLEVVQRRYKERIM